MSDLNCENREDPEKFSSSRTGVLLCMSKGGHR